MTKANIKQIIEDTFDEVSDIYDLNEYFLITAKEMVKNLEYKDNLNILDLSCGTGNISLLLASKFNTSKVEGIDLSSSMVNMANNKAKKEKLKNISFYKADVDSLKYKNNSLNLITCGFALFFYPDMFKSFKNFINLLTNDGMFIFSSFTKEAFAPYSDIFMETLQKDYALDYPKGAQSFLENKEEIENLVKSIDNLEYHIKEVKISKMISLEQWWETLNSAGYKGMLNQLSKENLIKFKKQHLSEISKFCVNGKLELKTNTLITMVSK